MKMKIDKAEQLKYIKKAFSTKKQLEKQCRELRRKISMARAKNRCEYYGCNNTKRLNDHHPFTKGAYPHLRFDLDNSIILCYNHHKGREGAHTDIHFKDKILGKYPGFKAIRDEKWVHLLDLKAQTKQKLDLKLELIYLQTEANKYEINEN